MESEYYRQTPADTIAFWLAPVRSAITIQSGNRCRDRYRGRRRDRLWSSLNAKVRRPIMISISDADRGPDSDPDIKHQIDCQPEQALPYQSGPISEPSG